MHLSASPALRSEPYGSFAGNEHDTVPGLYDVGAREYIIQGLNELGETGTSPLMGHFSFRFIFDEIKATGSVVVLERNVEARV
jgi:hypothetical protein